MTHKEIKGRFAVDVLDAFAVDEAGKKLKAPALSKETRVKVLAVKGAAMQWEKGRLS